MDSRAGDHRDDLADSLPSDSHQLWLRVRAGVSRQGQMDGRLAVRYQSCGESDLHADSVWHEKFAVGGGGHLNCLDHDHLVGGGDLAAIPMGESGPDPVFRVGLAGDRSATEHHMEQSVKKRNGWTAQWVSEITATAQQLMMGAISGTGYDLSDCGNRRTVYRLLTIASPFNDSQAIGGNVTFRLRRLCPLSIKAHSVATNRVGLCLDSGDIQSLKKVVPVHSVKSSLS